MENQSNELLKFIAKENQNCFLNRKSHESFSRYTIFCFMLHQPFDFEMDIYLYMRLLLFHAKIILFSFCKWSSSAKQTHIVQFGTKKTLAIYAYRIKFDYLTKWKRLNQYLVLTWNEKKIVRISSINHLLICLFAYQFAAFILCISYFFFFKFISHVRSNSFFSLARTT